MTMRRVGDIILDRYLPHATEEERAVARENLHLLAELMIRVHERLARGPQETIRANGELAVESESPQ